MKVSLRRFLHRVFFATVATATLIALFYAVEDWRGARAWEQFRRESQRRGESFEVRDHLPPPVPDAQNLAMAPLFVRAFRYRTDPVTNTLTFDPQCYVNNPTSRFLTAMPYPNGTGNNSKPSQHGAWNTGHRVGLDAWQTYYANQPKMPHPDQPGDPAADVLLAMTYFGSTLDELARAAAERPLARWPVNYTQRPSYGISLTHVTMIQGLQRTLRLRACARLAIGRTADARRDMDLLLRLNESIADEPTLIAGLVRANGIDFFLQPLWEGLAARQWSAGELAAFQAELAGLDLLRSFQHEILAGEILLFQGQLPDDMNHWKQAREMQRWMPLMQGTPPPAGTQFLWSLLPVLPRGWYAQNAALAGRLMQVGLIDACDPANHRVLPEKTKVMARTTTELGGYPYTFLAKVYLPTFETITVIPARGQTFIDLAVTACALERYFLDHRDYPGHLDALVPAYLARVPNDLIDGAPLRYRQTRDGRFQLWSIGWDQQDGGGSLEWPASRQWRAGTQQGVSSPAGTFPNPRKDQGDWVWQYAPAEPPDPPANTSRLE